MWLWCGPIIQCRKCMSLKFTGEFCVMTMKNYAKLVSWKLTWGIWRILTRALKNLKKLQFNRILLNKVYNIWVKKSTGELFHNTRVWCKICRKADLWLSTAELCLIALKIDTKFDMRSLSKFHQSSWKSPNWGLEGILLSKVENLWA